MLISPAPPLHDSTLPPHWCHPPPSSPSSLSSCPSLLPPCQARCLPPSSQPPHSHHFPAKLMLPCHRSPPAELATTTLPLPLGLPPSPRNEASPPPCRASSSHSPRACSPSPALCLPDVPASPTYLFRHQPFSLPLLVASGKDEQHRARCLLPFTCTHTRSRPCASKLGSSLPQRPLPPSSSAPATSSSSPAHLLHLPPSSSSPAHQSYMP